MTAAESTRLYRRRKVRLRLLQTRLAEELRTWRAPWVRDMVPSAMVAEMISDLYALAAADGEEGYE